jgi:hypothetical protein
MSGLSFEVLGAHPERYAAEPTLMLELQITEADARPVHAVALKCQVRIEPQRRRYERAEEERLRELFGETPRWGDSLRPFLWTHVATTVAAFTGTTTIDLPITCTYDFEIAASKYLHALDDGFVPLVLCFSGTVFSVADTGFRVTPVSWDQDASFLLPIKAWRDTMDLYFPNSGWLRVSRDTLDALQRYKATQGLPTWDQTLERLLKHAGEEER